VNVVLVHTELSAFHYAMNSTGSNTNVTVDAGGFNITAVGCEWDTTKKDAGFVLAEADRVLATSMDGEVANELVVRGPMKWFGILRLQKRHGKPPAFLIFDGSLALAACQDGDV